MADKVLLRFRDLVSGVASIEAHNEIARAQGTVLWGWWKKPLELMPDPGLTLLADGIQAESQIALIDSANRKIYVAPLKKIYYQPGGVNSLPFNPELCPEYYRTQSLPAWFEIGEIELCENSTNFLSEHIFSDKNRTDSTSSSSALNKHSVGIPLSDANFLDSNVSLWFITPTADVGTVSRAEIVPAISRGIWPAKGRYILHLSDLHFGDGHGFKNQLGTRSSTSLGSETMSEALLRDLSLMRIQDVDIAAVFITGDLTWRGDPHEFANAREFINILCDKLGLHNSNVIVIPGNHDIEWRNDNGATDPNAELNYANFLEGLYKSKPTSTFMRVQRILIANRKVTIVALNSCRIESMENAGMGYVGSEQLHDLTRYFQDDSLQDDIRIVLIHHHLLPVNYVEGIKSKNKMFSMTLDAEAILRTLIACNINYVFHGHQHQPYLAEIRRVINGYTDPRNGSEICLNGKLWIVGGGSLGVERAHLNTVGRNCYSLIDFGDDNRTLVVRTRIQSPVGPGFSDYHSCPLVM